MLADCTPTAILALRAPTTVRTSATHLALRALLHAVLAWPLCPRGSLPLRALSLGRRRSVFPIYPIVVSGRLHLDIRDIVVGHFLLDGFDMLDQPVWAPDGGHGGGDITAARVSSDEVNTLTVVITWWSPTSLLLALLAMKALTTVLAD